MNAELEIALKRLDAYRYSVDLRYTPPGHQTDEWVSGNTRFDLTALRAAALDDESYGQQLTAMLLSDDKLRAKLVAVRHEAEAADADLRLRLLIDQSAPELHTVRWERLAEPESGKPLMARQWVHFSRYLANSDWRPVRPRPESRLRALVVLASPSNLSDWGLTPIPEEIELPLAESGLHGMEIHRLTNPGQATRARILHHLRAGLDVVYLICHGAFDAEAGKPLLYLCSEGGEVEAVDGIEFANQIEDLTQRPRLVVLASCDSAGSVADQSAVSEAQLGALGPRLAKAGIPAVVAMHGPLSIETASAFMPVFLREVQSDGRVDRAMSVARNCIRDRPDWWKPVLFLRLRSGRLSYRPRLTGSGERVESQWKSLLNNISGRKCTPILGPGLTEYLMGGRREVARRWARAEDIDLPAEDRENLTQVAQFLATDRDESYPKDQLPLQLRKTILERYRPELESAIQAAAGARVIPPDELAKRIGRTPVHEQIRQIASHHMQRAPTEPHVVLARLPLPVYVTAGFTDLMTEALRLAGKRPRVEVFRWKETYKMTEDWGPTPTSEDGWSPTPEEPLVFHLFGRLEIPESLVLTEDDYFDYLLHLDRKNQVLPGVVAKSLMRSLLLLGFGSDDWGFRVLFRSIMDREGRALRDALTHIAVQVEPEEKPFRDPDRMRAYFERYLGRFKVSLFVGRVEDFSDELERRRKSMDDGDWTS